MDYMLQSADDVIPDWSSPLGTNARVQCKLAHISNV